MSIIFTCSCGKKYNLNDECAGTQVRCNACNTIITVPFEKTANDPDPVFPDSRAHSSWHAPRNPEGQPIYRGQQVNSGKALASLICGIGGLVACFIASIPGIILGHMALSEIKKSKGAIGGQGLAIAGLVTGYIALFFGAIATIAIIAAISIPSLLQSRLASQDQAAIANMKALHTANTTFNTMHAGLSDVFDPKYYGYCMQTQDLLDARMETSYGTERIRGVDPTLCAEEGKNANAGGYYFRYIVTSTTVKPDGLYEVTGYMLVAWPETIGKTGTKVYIVNEGGTIYYRATTADDEGIDPPLTKWPNNRDIEDWKSSAF